MIFLRMIAEPRVHAHYGDRVAACLGDAEPNVRVAAIKVGGRVTKRRVIIIILPRPTQLYDTRTASADHAFREILVLK